MKKLNSLLGLAIIAASTSSAVAEQNIIEEITVTEAQTKRVFFLEDQLQILPDTSQLLKKVPGGNVNGNGPLTGIPQYRGMYGPRIGVVVNGAMLAPAGPNWMDPPLSYVAPAQLVKLEVYRGIAPVSAAQESIGGAIVSQTVHGDFTDSEQFTNSGIVSIAGQSVSDALLVSGMASFANNRHHVSVAAMSEDGDDASFPEGSILPSSYERNRAEIVYGFKTGDHRFALDYTRNETGVAGTPALPMDIDYVDGDLLNASYQYDGASWALEANVFGSDLEHGMTNYHLRSAPSDKTMWRRNTTATSNQGFVLKGAHQDDSGEWRLGMDYFDEAHDSLIDNPNNAMFFVEGFNDATRTVTGIFAEREQRLSNRTKVDLGLRINHIEMSADEVNGTPAMMMPPAAALRDNFNAADRDSSDTNVDATAQFWVRTSDSLSWYAGVAKKTRTASFQERYLWLPLQSTGGLADGFTYTGNLNLKPEDSNEIEAGLDFTNSKFSLSPRIFYREVSDFIQGTPTQDSSAVMFIRMMDMANGTSNPDPLQFNNVDATLYGFDVDWNYDLNEAWSFSGLFNYVRGKRDDIDDNLYRIAPANITFAVQYAQNSWTANAEIVAYANQNKVSSTNNESPTEGYELVNISASYRVNEQFRVSIGGDNLLNELYQDHLTGYNRASNPDVALGVRLPGYGRNVFLKADYRW